MCRSVNCRKNAWFRSIVSAEGYNTIEIVNSGYIAIENLRIDSLGIPGAFGISARGHEENVTHHIRVEGNTLVGQNGGQQTDGIATKTPHLVAATRPECGCNPLWWILWRDSLKVVGKSS